MGEFLPVVLVAVRERITEDDGLGQRRELSVQCVATFHLIVSLHSLAPRAVSVLNK